MSWPSSLIGAAGQGFGGFPMLLKWLLYIHVVAKQSEVTTVVFHIRFLRACVSSPVTACPPIREP